MNTQIRKAVRLRGLRGSLGEIIRHMFLQQGPYPRGPQVPEKEKKYMQAEWWWRPRKDRDSTGLEVARCFQETLLAYICT